MACVMVGAEEAGSHLGCGVPKGMTRRAEPVWRPTVLWVSGAVLRGCVGEGENHRGVRGYACPNEV